MGFVGECLVLACVDCLFWLCFVVLMGVGGVLIGLVVWVLVVEFGLNMVAECFSSGWVTWVGVDCDIVDLMCFVGAGGCVWLIWVCDGLC